MITADFLLIDIGNTSAKLRLADGRRLLAAARRLHTAALLAPGGAAALKKMLVGWKYGRAVLSSVVPEAARVVAELLPGVLPIDARTDSGVDLRGYPGRKTLGADRIANMAGALVRHGPGPLVVVDFGTAATFNALDARGHFLGGVIAPGLGGGQRDYLPARGGAVAAGSFGGCGTGGSRAFDRGGDPGGGVDRLPGNGAGDSQRPGRRIRREGSRCGDRRGRAFPGGTGVEAV